MLQNINIKNKKASFEYQFIDKYIAGIALLGSEIKSIRNNEANISDAYCIIKNHEVFLINLHISEYKNASLNNHNPKRERKLLLNKQEINKIEKKTKEKGNTIIPIRLFINNKGKAKVEISVAKGKKIYDKREDIKERDMKRSLEQIKKDRS
tara:strand:+ start:443 stop:898 length:456 start_codon:yes stop_codon:yes gene_type:complete